MIDDVLFAPITELRRLPTRIDCSGSSPRLTRGAEPLGASPLPW